jgi:hypothetical protein
MLTLFEKPNNCKMYCTVQSQLIIKNVVEHLSDSVTVNGSNLATKSHSLHRFFALCLAVPYQECGN